MGVNSGNPTKADWFGGKKSKNKDKDKKKFPQEPRGPKPRLDDEDDPKRAIQDGLDLYYEEEDDEDGPKHE